ncbi:MAG: family 1 glycosylhydrolase [Proteobacteria bacterium]|nr:family 1 glycosylhydrolase [Pseudomonadota bacterium]
MDGKFLWGTATAAHQIEGNNVNSDFWLAEHVTPTLFKEPSGDACDSLHRYAEDTALATSLGFNAHRFGIEWARIEPEPGEFSPAALDHYKRVLDDCHSKGLTPMVTLSHWTVPRWFAARGGFEQADSPDTFARFTEQVAKHLGPLMGAATTFNECNIPRLARLLFKLDSPLAQAGIQAMSAACAKACGSDRWSSVLFSSPDKTEAQMVAAHHRAVEILKAGPGSYPVGLTISMQAVEGIGPGNKAAEVADALYGPWLAAAKPCDFVGVQTYTRIRVGAEGPLSVPAGSEMTDAGYEFYPQALGETVRFAAKATGKPIYVTENGIATGDDTRRVAYIDGALDALRKARADGIDVRGYFHWSLLDNFEWTAGYAQHFGLVEVDRTTFKRTPKPSAVHLGRIARADSI